jgi:hypothetical protein
MSDGPETPTPEPHVPPGNHQAERDAVAPDIAEALREFNASGRAGLKALHDVTKALSQRISRWPAARSDAPWR